MVADRVVELLRPFREDFLYYAPRALKIKDKAGRVRPFRVNRAQMHLHRMIEEQRARTGKVRVLGLKGRQQGFSTYVQGRYFWKVSGERGKRAFTLTHLNEATDNLFKMTKLYYDRCPEELKPSARYNSKHELTFDRLDSEFSVATAKSEGTGRSATAQYFHGSEVAFWDNAQSHMEGLAQTIPNAPGTEIILESTANGVGNLFHDKCQDAMRGIGDFILIFVPWFWQEEYAVTPPVDWRPSPEDAEYGDQFGLNLAQLYWRERKVVDDFRGNVSSFDQEYPATPALAFKKVSGDILIPVDLVLRARKRKGTPQIEGANVIGIDPAEYGTDATAFAPRIGRVALPVERHYQRGPMEVVALAARFIDAHEHKFGPCDAINVDCTGIGSGIADRLLELDYPIHRVHFGERAIDTKKYRIRRDEMWGEMLEWFEDVPCWIPDDDVLQTDLTAPQYHYDSSRRLVLESKESMRNRGVSSPDSGDALALTFATRVNPGAGRGSKRADRGTYNWRA